MQFRSLLSFLSQNLLFIAVNVLLIYKSRIFLYNALLQFSISDESNLTRLSIYKLTSASLVLFSTFQSMYDEYEYVGNLCPEIQLEENDHFESIIVLVIAAFR